MELQGYFPENEPVAFYARNSQHIVDLVQYYYDQAKREGRLNDPKIANWAKNIITLDQIKLVERGGIKYHVGMACIRTGDSELGKDLFSEKLQVADDFIVAVSPEALFYFDAERQGLEFKKRGELYKFQIRYGPFSSLTFIPEDVMRGIVSYDLAPHKKRAEEFQGRIQQAKAGSKHWK